MLFARVLSRYDSPVFHAFYDHFPPESLGCLLGGKADPLDMKRIYSRETVEALGAVAFVLELLPTGL